MIKSIKEKIATIESEMRSMIEAAKATEEKRMSAEDGEKYDALSNELKDLRKDLSRAEEAEALDKRAAQQRNSNNTEGDDKEAELRAFLNVFRGTASAEERAAVTLEGNKMVVPAVVHDEIMVGLQGTYGILPHIDLTVSQTAETVTYPIATAPITLEKVAIGTPSTEGSANFIGVQLSAHDFRTQPIPVSETLLAASNADLKAAIVSLFVEHIGRALSQKIITSGTDNKDFAAILSSATVVNGEANDEITYDDIVNLMSAVKAPFDAVGRAKFVVNSTTRKALLKLRDNHGYPIYVPSAASGMPATLFGYEVVVDDAVPATAAKAKAMIFGDLKTYKARLVKGVRVRTYDEQKYADFGCIGVQGFVTGDGRPVRSAGNVEPIACLQLAE